MPISLPAVFAAVAVATISESVSVNVVANAPKKTCGINAARAVSLDVPVASFAIMNLPPPVMIFGDWLNTATAALYALLAVPQSVATSVALV